MCNLPTAAGTRTSVAPPFRGGRRRNLNITFGLRLLVLILGCYMYSPFRLEMVMYVCIVYCMIGMQIEILNGIKKLPLYGSFQVFKRKESWNRVS